MSSTGGPTKRINESINAFHAEVLTRSGNQAPSVLKSIYCFYPVFFLKDRISPCGNECCIEFDDIVKASESSLALSPEQQLDYVKQRNMLVGFVRSS